jgi:receptor protein-tyrosine kinase
MTDKGSTRLNLIDRLSEKLEPREKKAPAMPLVERAMAKLIGDTGSDSLKGTNNGVAPLKARDSFAPRALQREVNWTDEEALRFVEIDLARMSKAGYVIPDGRRNRIKEQFRIIKRPLLLNAFQRESRTQNPHIILVTSACPGEGKTFTATNLAMSIAAEREVKVLLIDGDVIRQDLSRRFGIETERGYLDLLEDETLDVSDIIVRTSIPSLALMPAGKIREEATELFSSSRMKALFEELASRYQDRIIIIDTPPVLASSEANALAMHAGQLVMVIEAGRTPRHTLQEALNLLAPCEQTYCILNKAADSDHSDRYGSYYEYYPSDTKG